MIITKRSGAYVTGYQLVTVEGLNIVNLEGDVLGADPLFLQIHNTAAVPANAAVPIRSMRLVANNGFRWYNAPELMDLPAGGIYIVLSTTEATFTATAATMNLFIDIEDYAGLGKIPSDASTSGDLVTQVTTQTIWTEAAGPKKLYRLQVTESVGLACYVQLFAVDTPAQNAVPILQWPLAANASIDLRFGEAGKTFLSQTAAGVNKKGLTIGLSLASGTFDQSGTGTIKGTYHA